MQERVRDAAQAAISTIALDAKTELLKLSTLVPAAAERSMSFKEKATNAIDNKIKDLESDDAGMIAGTTLVALELLTAAYETLLHNKEQPYMPTSLRKLKKQVAHMLDKQAGTTKQQRAIAAVIDIVGDEVEAAAALGGKHELKLRERQRAAPSAPQQRQQTQQQPNLPGPPPNRKDHASEMFNGTAFCGRWLIGVRRHGRNAGCRDGRCSLAPCAGGMDDAAVARAMQHFRA